MHPSQIISATNWKYALGEVLLIVVGVSIALAASSWYENRQLRGVEISTLAQLQATLREDLDTITGSHDTIGRVNQGIASFVERIETGNLKQVEITSGIGSIGRFVTLSLRSGPYETLKGRGLDLISNQSLRVKITSLYEDEIPNLVEDSVIDRRLVRDQILPSILEWFWMDASEEWNLKESLPAGWQRDLVTLGRYRAMTLDGYYLPSFEHTMRLMRDVLAEIEVELSRSRPEEQP
jgi:hypothetical protein